MTGLKNAGGALLARLTSALQKHPKRATAALATVLLTGGSGAFAVASLGPDPADLPVRTLTEPVTSLAAGQDLADLTDLQSFSLYRSEYTRSNDTTESLLQRLGIADPQAAAFMRSNEAVRQNVLGRAGRLVSAQTTPDQQLSQLTVRWAPSEDGSFQRLTVERVDGKLQSKIETGKLTASPRLGAADATPQRIGQAGSDDVLVREHRHGDDLRRVHWKMTARQGDLMVRLEEHPWDPSSTLVVDTRTGAHFGQGPGSSLEWAVSAVTSVAAQLAEGRHRLTIVSPAGLACDPGHTLGEAALQLVLEAMTDLTSSEETWLGAAVADPQLLGASATIVAATGRLTAHDAAALAAAGTRALSRVALAPDVEAWGGEPGEHADALRLLRNHAWTVELYGPRTGVAEAWRRATT